MESADINAVRNYYKMKSIDENKYYLMASKYADNIFDNPSMEESNVSYFSDLFQEWDNFGSIPLELGNYIENLLNDSSVVLGIHRTGGNGVIDINDVTGSNVLQSIFNEGLKNMGDLSSGAGMNSIPEPNKTVSVLHKPIHAVMSLKGQYKGSVGGVLVAFPAAFVDDSGEIINNSYNDIYTFIDNIPTIKSKYLLGFVASDKGVCTYYPKDSFIKGKNL